MSKSDFDLDKIDLSHLKFAEQDGIDQFEDLAREFLPAILGQDFDQVIITDESSVSDFCGWLETREEFDAWERKVLQRVEDRYGVRPTASGFTSSTYSATSGCIGGRTWGSKRGAGSEVGTRPAVARRPAGASPEWFSRERSVGLGRANGA